MILAVLVSNLVALVLLLVCWKRKNAGRILFAVLFLWAAYTNWKTAHSNPAVYLEYGKYAAGFYKNIIHGEFSRHITGYVSFIAICQLIIGLGFFARGLIVKLSCLGGILFLLAIAPLGMGSAFPFSLIASAALFILYRYSFTKDVFKNKWWV